MVEEFPADYLGGLPESLQEELALVNGPGLAALRDYLASGQAVAFLGAGASAPLYPLWEELIKQLVEASSARLDEQEAVTLGALAKQRPESVVEIVRQQVGEAQYQQVLREILRMRTDPESGRSWTAVHELVCRCAFKAVVTTNYDPGIVNARMRVRQDASSTGFTTWQDELRLDQWRRGDLFGTAELPVLFAHGHYNQPDSVVLAATEYRRCYQGKLPGVLGQLMDTGHLVWIGFSFADQRITAILRQIAEGSGTRVSPGAAPRHVAIMAWDPASEGNDPGILARLAAIDYGAQAVLYPAPGSDHSALALLLAAFTDPRFRQAGDLPARPGPLAAEPDRHAIADTLRLPLTWVPEPERVEHFTGRGDELARLDRWAADPQVALVGVTGLGGAGKTALVTRWVQDGGAARLPGVRGVFGWSFYADPSAEHWASALLDWARQDLGVTVPGTRRAAAAVLQLLRTVPLLLVLDGLEVMQEGPAGGEFGRLLDGTLREVLVGACWGRHESLIVLTSRLPFADLESYDGGSARMLDMPAFTISEGSDVLASAGAEWLDEGERRQLVAAVGGHALAVEILALALADRPPTSEVLKLHRELTAAARTSERVGKVMKFYAGMLSEPDRNLIAAVSLFARPVTADAIASLAHHEPFEKHFADWTAGTVTEAVRNRLSGLITQHADGTLSAHPLVASYFRPLASGSAQIAGEIALTGLPSALVTSRAAALRVAEVIELLLDAGQWSAADHIYSHRIDDGVAWATLPAPRLGQRTAGAFVATAKRRGACRAELGPRRQAFYLAELGLYATEAGDLATGKEYLPAAVAGLRAHGDIGEVSNSLGHLAFCLGLLGEIGAARDAAQEGADLACCEMHTCFALSYLGWLASLRGDSIEADRQFRAADEIQVDSDPDRDHLYGPRGIHWADWLTRIGDTGLAWSLTDRNRDICLSHNWDRDAAGCERMLGHILLAEGLAGEAGPWLEQAVDSFRASDSLCDLADGLTDLAEYARQNGDLDAAVRHADEARDIAAPRGMVAARSAALAVRAMIYADRAAATSDGDELARGRDAADAALRLAEKYGLGWHQHDALRGHARLDQQEGVAHGWAERAKDLHARLVPPLPPLIAIRRWF